MSELKKLNVRVPKKYADMINKMVESEFFSSKAEAVRTALRKFLVEQKEFFKDFEENERKLTEIHKKYNEFKAKRFAGKFDLDIDTPISVGNSGESVIGK